MSKNSTNMTCLIIRTIKKSNKPVRYEQLQSTAKRHESFKVNEKGNTNVKGLQSIMSALQKKLFSIQ